MNDKLEESWARVDAKLDEALNIIGKIRCDLKETKDHLEEARNILNGSFLKVRKND